MGLPFHLFQHVLAPKNNQISHGNLASKELYGKLTISWENSFLVFLFFYSET
jgi:hypothetical protein